MESRNHNKNGAVSKSHMSRKRKLNQMTSILFILGAFSTVHVLILVAVVTVLVLGSRANTNDDETNVISNQTNKVVNVSLKGGIIGMLAGSPQKTLNSKIQEENANGWKVIQIIPADSGNIFLYIFRLILLVFTLFLFTTSNGFYVIMERQSEKLNNDMVPSHDVIKCSKCGKEYFSVMKGGFCEECGNQL